MFVCRSCLHRGYATLHKAARKAVGIPVIARTPRPSTGSDLIPKSSTYASRRPGASINNGESTIGQPTEPTSDTPQKPKAPSPSTEQPPGRAKRELVDPKVHRAVKKELQWLSNEYNIGQHVQATLAKGKFVEALHLVREASKDYKLTVSWNHLIEYELEQQHLHAAIKLFNEMKKRAQLPNAQTYTIIFKGCAAQTHAKQAVAEATRIFTSMMNRERIEPNTIHLNAVLDVCAKAEDLESLLNVAQAAGGKLQLDNQSYTTILNCLRATTKIRKTAGQTVSQESAEDAQVTIMRAKALWEEIVAKWRKGRINMDEELVCAMGRILLLGSAKDCADIRALVQQTMGIATEAQFKLKSAPKLSNEAAQAKALPGASVASDSPGGKVVGGSTSTDPATEGSTAPRHSSVSNLEASVTEARQGNNHASTAALAQAVAVSEAPALTPVIPNPSPQFLAVKTSNQALARPGNNVLSLLLTACYNTYRPATAMQYWTLLTVNHSVEPDSDNFYRIIQALHRGKDSANTVKILKQMPLDWLQPKTFRLAMATCLHNHKNPEAFANASEILLLGDRNMKKPDYVVLDKYLVTALECNQYFRKMYKDGHRALAKHEFGKQVLFAMDRLWEQMRRYWAFDSYPDVDVKGCAREWDAMKTYRLEFAALQRRLLAVYSKLVEEKLLDDPTVLRTIDLRRNTLNKRLTEFFKERQFQGEKINEMHEALSKQRGAEQKATHRRIVSGVVRRKQTQKVFSWLREEEVEAGEASTAT